MFFTPQAMKAFIEANYKMIDLNGDGVINAEEFRYNCITRIAVDDIKVVDDAYNTLLNVSTL
jgi:EF hand